MEELADGFGGCVWGGVVNVSEEEIDCCGAEVEVDGREWVHTSSVPAKVARVSKSNERLKAIGVLLVGYTS